MARMLASGAEVVDVLPASEALGLGASDFLHAGPPIDWQRASGPMRGALIGAAMFEGLAATPDEAEALLASGTGYTLDPCHHHAAVGPMAGVVSRSMWVFVLADGDRRTYCSLNEGLGKVLRYGAYGPEVLDRLRWMSDVLGPLLQQAIRAHGPVDVKAILAQMVHMGDEAHNRNRAGTLMFLREILPDLIRAGDGAAEVAAFIGGNDHFFLNLAMPACKLALDAARDVPGSTMVVAMARNGTDFGIQVSGTGDRWFTGPANTPGRPVPRRLRPRRRQPRHRRLGDHRDRRASAASRWRQRPRSSASSAGRSTTRSPTPGGCTRSRSPSTPCSRCRCSTSAARRAASTSRPSCAPGSCRRSTPAWPDASPAPARSAPGWSRRPARSSRPPLRALAELAPPL